MHKSVSLIPYIYTPSYGLQQTLHRLLVDLFPDNAKWQEGHYPHSCRRTEKSTAQSGSLILSDRAVFKITEIR